MPFETLKASIYALMDEIAKRPDNLHELQEQVREELAELKGMGQPLPQDLVELEEWLEQTLESHGAGDAKFHSGAERAGGGGQGNPGKLGRRHPPPHSEES